MNHEQTHPFKYFTLIVTVKQLKVYEVLTACGTRAGKLLGSLLQGGGAGRSHLPGPPSTLPTGHHGAGLPHPFPPSPATGSAQHPPQTHQTQTRSLHGAPWAGAITGGHQPLLAARWRAALAPACPQQPWLRCDRMAPAACTGDTCRAWTRGPGASALLGQQDTTM